MFAIDTRINLLVQSKSTRPSYPSRIAGIHVHQTDRAIAQGTSPIGAPKDRAPPLYLGLRTGAAVSWIGREVLLAIQTQAPAIESVVTAAIRGFAKGKNFAPKRFNHTTSMGEPQQPTSQHPTRDRTPVKVSPPTAKRPAPQERLRRYRRRATAAKAKEAA